MENPLNCPNCGLAPRLTAAVFDTWHCFCDNCYDGGPVAWGHSKDEAIEYWNADVEIEEIET